jgi:hypothetical protein
MITRYRMLKMTSNKAAGELQPEAYPLGYVEDCFEPRTQVGKGRVLARLGSGGCNQVIFSIRL